MRPSRHAARGLALGAAVLGLAWLFVLPRSVALYDGLGYPDEPYRYVHPPGGSRPTPAPTGASATSAGPARSLQLASAEQGPQIALRFNGGSFTAANGPVTVDVSPVAAAVPAPATGTVVGNVYSVTSTDRLVPGASATIDMRAPTAGQPGPVFESLQGGTWTALPTERVGNDIYRARLNRLGDWALVQVARVTRDGQNDFGTSDSFNGIEAVLAIAGPVAIIVTVIVFIRSGRRSSARRRAGLAAGSGRTAPPS